MDGRVNTTYDPSTSDELCWTFRPLTPDFRRRICAGQATRWALRHISSCCCCCYVDSMVDMRSTPDSAVSPTYHSYQAGRYDVDVPLEPFYYPVCAPSSSLIADVTQLAADGLVVQAAGYPPTTGLHHGSNKRLKYAAVDDFGTVSFARTESHHQHVACQQSIPAWNAGVSSHGMNITDITVHVVMSTFHAIITRQCFRAVRPPRPSVRPYVRSFIRSFIPLDRYGYHNILGTPRAISMKLTGNIH